MKKIFVFTRCLLCIGLGMVICIIQSCGKAVPSSDVLTNLIVSDSIINADGSTLDTISVELNSNASADRLNVIFTASAGTLINGQSGQVTVAANFKNTRLIATAILKAPMSASKIIITAAPQIPSPIKDYTLKDSITANNVIATSIKLETSSFGIGSNFINTDSISGTLKSSINKKVSVGTKVIFEDYFINGSPAGGRFRSVTNSSDTTSHIMALYSAADLPTGTDIYVKATVLDNMNSKTNICDSVLLTINQ